MKNYNIVWEEPHEIENHKKFYIAINKWNVTVVINRVSKSYLQNSFYAGIP